MSASARCRRIKVPAPHHEVLAPPFDWVAAAFMGLDHSAHCVREALPPDDVEEVIAAYQPAGRHLCAVMDGADLEAHESAIEELIAALDDVLERFGVAEVAWEGMYSSLSPHKRRRYRAAAFGLGVLLNTVPRTPEFEKLHLEGKDQFQAALRSAFNATVDVLLYGRRRDVAAVVPAFRHLDDLLGKIHVRPVFPLHRPSEQSPGAEQP